MKRVCLVSSGTGGHLLPAVALGHALRAHGHCATLLTEGRAVESALLDRCANDGDRSEASELHVGGGGLSLPLRLAQATVTARRFYRDHEVDVVVGAGGRTTVPAAIAARSLGVPLFLLEQNVVTGRANRMLMPLAERIYHGLPPSRLRGRGVVTGTPLRTKVGKVGRDEARCSLGLDMTKPVILVTGGSQGARSLNETVPAALGRLAREIQVVHLSGESRDTEVRNRYNECDHIEALVRPMVMDMASLYAAADLVICRGGGGTVAELMMAGRASIIVPYPHHRDRQQWHNGRVLSEAGAAHLIEEPELTTVALAGLLEDLLAPADRLEEMGAAAQDLAPTDPSEQILTDMLQLGALD